MTEKIKQFLANERPATPCLVVDADRVVENYRDLARGLPGAEIYYAIKANPAPQILSALAGEGSCFDAASIHEVGAALKSGAAPKRISFGNFK